MSHVASFDAGLRTLAIPSTGQEHRLRTLLATGGALDESDDPLTARGATVLASRRSAAFTRFDGNLGHLAVPSPVDAVTSPTRLERWAKCPHAHLVEDLLRAAPVENPEDSLMMTALDKGSLIHSVLELFIAEVLACPPADRPPAHHPWTPADQDRLEQIGGALCDQAEALGTTGRPIFWRRDRKRILDDLAEFLVQDSRYRAAVPHLAARGRARLRVRRPGGRGRPPARRPLAPGAGAADRIDLGDDGTIHVVDYKTGSSEYTKLSELDPIAGGTKLQLPIYGLAGRLHRGDPRAAVRADYWFVTSRGRWKRVGYDVTDHVLAGRSPRSA